LPTWSWKFARNATAIGPQLWDQAFSEGNTALAAQYQASIQQEYQAIQALQRQVQLSLEDLSETALAEDL
jgi:DNA primase